MVPRRLTLDDLDIEDERSFRHVALYAELKQVLRRDAYKFRVIENASWDRALFLNLTFWDAAEQGDVLCEASVPADVVMHAAWHHLARRGLGAASTTADGLLMGEAIASAFDLYLVGRLLGHAPDSAFLGTQVPALAEAAEAAGLAEPDFEALLEDIALDPDRAFEDLRGLLFETVTDLLACSGAEAACAVLERADKHRFGPLLHHYELSTWVLYARAYASHALAPDPAVRALDAALHEAKSSVDELERRWLP